MSDETKTDETKTDGKHIELGIPTTCTKCGHSAPIYIPPGEWAKRIWGNLVVPEIHAAVQADRERLAAVWREIAADAPDHVRDLIELCAGAITERALPGGAPSPNRFDCSECGWGVAADEDGCCATCGSDTTRIVDNIPMSIDDDESGADGR